MSNPTPSRQPEPVWYTWEDSVFVFVTYALVFLIVIPLILMGTFELIWFFMDRELSNWISFFICGLMPSLLVLKAMVDSKKFLPKKITVKAGMVQFMQCSIPGIDFNLKLGKGPHHVFPFFIEWGEAWSYQVTWPVNIPEYRASAPGHDVIIKVVSKIAPDPNWLLPLQLLRMGTLESSNTDSFVARIVDLISGVYRKTIEQIVGTLMEEVTLDDGTKELRPFDDVGDIIKKSKEFEEGIVENLGTQELGPTYGIEVKAFSIDDANAPPSVEKARDSVKSVEVMRLASLEGAGAGGLTAAQLLEASQLNNGDISQTRQINVTQWHPETLAGFGTMLERGLQIVGGIFANRGAPPTPPPPAPPSILGPDGRPAR